MGRECSEALGWSVLGTLGAHGPCGRSGEPAEGMVSEVTEIRAARTGRALRMCGMAEMSGSLIAPSRTPQGQPHSPAWSGCRAEH